MPPAWLDLQSTKLTPPPHFCLSLLDTLIASVTHFPTSASNSQPLSLSTKTAWKREYRLALLLSHKWWLRLSVRDISVAAAAAAAFGNSSFNSMPQCSEYSRDVFASSSTFGIRMSSGSTYAPPTHHCGGHQNNTLYYSNATVTNKAKGGLLSPSFSTCGKTTKIGLCVMPDLSSSPQSVTASSSVANYTPSWQRHLSSLHWPYWIALRVRTKRGTCWLHIQCCEPVTTTTLQSKLQAT